MEPTWEIVWDHDGWRVELTRYPSKDEYVSVGITVGHCIVYGNKIGCIEPPWPWQETPTNPAEVCAMCERLADQYNLEAKLAKLRVMKPGEVVADDARSFS